MSEEKKEFNARCIICDSTDEWQNVDHLIHKEQGAHICKKCGFVTYDSIQKVEEMKEHYRSKNNEYRAAPTVINEFQQERKTHYHGAFLAPLFEQWKEEKKKLTVFESGSAYGRFLHWIKTIFPDSEVYGTELTITMRRVAEHFFGIKLDEEFDASRKYDFIASYKVAEHVPDIDVELRKQVECLRDNESRVYIGVPQWWQQQACFGTPEWSMAEYYHPNHINMWTRKLFETLLRKVGLEVLEKNHVFYDSVYLCRRNDAVMAENPQWENYEEIIEKMEVYKKANDFFEAGKYKEALDVNPTFPQAVMRFYEMNRAELNKRRDDLDKFLNFALQKNPESAIVTAFVGSVMARYENYNAAIELFTEALKMKPHDSAILLNLAQVFREKKDFVESANVCKHIIATSSQHKPEATTWFLHDIANMKGSFEGESE